MTEVLSLSERYYRRLHIDPTSLDTEPTIKKLQILMEAHLLYIPFENIAQHGGGGGHRTSCQSDYDDDESYKQRQIVDINTVASNVLDNNRGGFCLELNTLFTYWLETELYYPIHLVSADVAHDDPTDNISDNATTATTNTNNNNKKKNKRKVFLNHEAHIVPFCTTIDDNYMQQYMIDIAFGEPSIHPLQYPSLNKIQITPENMISQFIRTSYQQFQYTTNNNNNNGNCSNDNDIDNNTDDNGQYVMLLWYLNNEWVPRLRWNYNDSLMYNDTPKINKKSVLEQVMKYQYMYDCVHHPECGFAQKLIITKLSRYQKISFAGTKFKTTGPSRFPLPPPCFIDNTNTIFSNNNQDRTTTGSKNQTVNETSHQHDHETVPVTIEYYDNDDTIRQLLLDIFGIPISETQSMKFLTGKSSCANPLLWDQF